jgi:hypothetical protein
MLHESCHDLRDVGYFRRAFSEIPLQPFDRCALELRRAALAVEVHELQSILERELPHLPGGVLGGPEVSMLKRALEPRLDVALRGHEHMFAETLTRSLQIQKDGRVELARLAREVSQYCGHR